MLRKTLATLPKPLNQTYERILLNIDEEYAVYAKRFMKWLAYSARPLQLKELAEIVTVEVAEEPRVDPLRRLPDPQDVLTICSSLVAVKQPMSVPIIHLTEPEGIADTQDCAPNDIDHEVEKNLYGTAQENGPYHFEVTLAHFSVKEYLISTDIQTGPVKDYAVTEQDASKLIAETCLAYLLQFNTKTSLTYLTISRYPIAQYAVKYWPSHYKDAEEEGGLLRQLAMELLCSGAFFYCVSLYHPFIGSSRNFRTFDRSFLPLHYTCAHGMTDLVKCVLEEKAKAVTIDRQSGINAMSPFGTALAIASFQGHLDTVKVLLENHANVNDGLRQIYKDMKHVESLIARDGGLYAILYLLVNNEFDACFKGGIYVTPLHLATVNQNEEVVRILLDHDVDLEIPVGIYGTALHITCVLDCESIVRLLLERGADVEAGGDKDCNALQSASLLGHEAVVRVLLEHGANVNMLGGFNGSPLGAAIAGKHFATVGVLLDAGADVNLSRGFNQPKAPAKLITFQPHLHDALNRPEIVRLLLARGAHANARNTEGKMALSAALETETSHGSVPILLDYGASLFLLDDTDMERFNKLRPKLRLATEANDDRKDD